MRERPCICNGKKKKKSRPNKAGQAGVSRRVGENEFSRGSCLSGLPLRQLLSLRRDFRLKVSLETAFWLQAAPTAFQLSFHQPGGADKEQVNQDQ